MKTGSSDELLKRVSSAASRQQWREQFVNDVVLFAGITLYSLMAPD